MYLIEYTTKSGSTYIADPINKRIRRVGKGSVRATPDWKPYEDLNGGHVGEALVIFWGTGEDEYSDKAETKVIGDLDAGGVRARFTTTSAVVKLAFPFMED